MSRGDFWSRRKDGVAAEERAEQAALEAAHFRAREAELAEKTDEELLEEHGLAAPETLDSTEAVQAFLRSELPQRLKLRALRRLWRLNPVLANLDGLVDYGEDYTDAATVVENLQTAYQVGKGMLSSFQDLNADAPEEQPVENVSETAASRPEPESASRAEAEDPHEGQGPAAVDAAGGDKDEVAQPVHVTSRRMQFRFEPAT